MNLCRFSLRDEPETVRSGIFHEQRIYETQGTQAVGVHELSKVILLPPVSQTPTLRVFNRHSDGTWEYQYRNPHFAMGPLAEFDPPVGVKALDFNVRIAAITREGGAQIELHEAEEFIMGYTLFIEFFREEMVAGDHKSDAAAYAFPYGLGPFLTTNDMVLGTTEQPVSEWNIIVKVNGIEVHTETQAPLSMDNFLVQSSIGTSLLPAEIICGPAISKPLLRHTPLDRPLIAGDTVQVIHSRIGALTIKIV